MVQLFGRLLRSARYVFRIRPGRCSSCARNEEQRLRGLGTCSAKKTVEGQQEEFGSLEDPPQDVFWPTCDQDGCIGIRLETGTRCWRHARGSELNTALEQVANGSKIDARGTRISRALLQEIIARVPRNDEGCSILTDAAFENAIFEGNANFERVIFAGSSRFDRAIFNGDARFSNVTFTAYTQFLFTTFKGDVEFGGTTFENGSWFAGSVFGGSAFGGNVTFGGEATFSNVTFNGSTGFGGSTFQDEANFNGTKFLGEDTTFRGVTFERNAHFMDTTFRGYAWFDRAIFNGSVLFDETTFQQATQLGPFLTRELVSLNSTLFSQAVHIEASAGGLRCCRARFPDGVQFKLRWAQVIMDDTDFSVPSLLIGARRLADADLAAQEQTMIEHWNQEDIGEISERPSLLSLQRANVAALSLANVNLASCRFGGSHNLDQLRLEADVTFGLSPAPVRWEQRQVIAEECAWREHQARKRQHSSKWRRPDWPPWAGEEPPVLTTGEIAGLYRAVRKGREDAKDEPGAADFYYGETEMRRHANNEHINYSEHDSRGQADRGVLTAYWILSGYGLRAWRSLAWFTGVTVVFALAFYLIGFNQPPQPVSYWTSLLYSFRATISLTDTGVKLTAWGELLQALLRLTGPLLLGLALLAFRGRVKR